MSEPLSTVSTAGYCAVTGALCYPALQAIGIDPSSLILGFLGAVIAQLLLPPRSSTALGVVGLTLGSVLLAGLLNPLVAPMLQQGWETAGQKTNVRFASAAFIGAFAKPLLMMIRDTLLPFLVARLVAVWIALTKRGTDV